MLCAKNAGIMKKTDRIEIIEMLTRRDLACRWRVSIETLKRREKAGLLRALKIGNGIRYRLSDILNFEASAEVVR